MHVDLPSMEWIQILPCENIDFCIDLQNHLVNTFPLDGYTNWVEFTPTGGVQIFKIISCLKRGCIQGGMRVLRCYVARFITRIWKCHAFNLFSNTIWFCGGKQMKWWNSSYKSSNVRFWRGLGTSFGGIEKMMENLKNIGEILPGASTKFLPPPPEGDQRAPQNRHFFKKVPSKNLART